MPSSTLPVKVQRSCQRTSDAKVTVKATIVKAKIATTAISKSYEEYRLLCRQEDAGIKPLKEKVRLTQIRSEREASLELNRQVVGLLKLGESVFTYPGLLALSEVDYNEQSNEYSMRLVVDYRGYEGGSAEHPTYRVIEFGEDGRITAIEEFATVKMVTE